MLEVPELPSFEAANAEDRPPPPSISDYPIGCEVGLVDINLARVAQTDEFWEPFMDRFFTQGRRTVRVVRHLGEYTFVVSEDDSMTIGCMLYRACLCEPKVRIGKYGGADAVGFEEKSAHSVERCISTFPLAHDREGETMCVGNLPALNGGVSGAVKVSGPRPSGGLATPLDELQREGACETEQANKGQVTQDEQRYNYAMIRAYDARLKRDYSEAVRYCTKALKYSADGGVRALANRSAMYLSLRDPTAALSDALKVVELMPGSHVGYVRAGNAMRGLRRNREARDFYQEALRLDPNNETVKFLDKDNAVFLAYATKRRRGQQGYVTVDRQSLNTVLVSGKDQLAGEVVWEESTAIVAPLGEFAYHCDMSVSPCLSKVCGNCYRPLTDAKEISASLPGVELSLLNELLSGYVTVSCTYKCGTMFCSESCRTNGWASHHWIECPVIGKWREAFEQIPDIYRSFYVEYGARINTGVNHNGHLNASEVGCSSMTEGGGSPASFTLSTGGDVTRALIACCRLACRMVVESVSRSQPLEDVALPFNWLLPESCDYLLVSEGGKDCSVSALLVEKVLRPVYATLEKCFDKEERDSLSFSLFVCYFERARLNSIKLRVSLWPTVQRGARALKEGYADANFPTGFSPPAVAARSRGGDSLDKQLQQIQSTQARAVAGYYEYLALFTAFPAAFSPRSTRSKRSLGAPRYNLSLKSCIEPRAMIQVLAIENIAEGEQMVVDRSHTTYFV